MSKEVKNYINNVLREKREEFSGKAVCPFAGPELDSNKLMIATVGENNLLQLIHEFKLSDYESALFVIKDDVPAEQTKKFQIFVNKLLKHQGLPDYKSICFNPNDQLSVEGYNPRSQSPHFMVNIAHKKVLAKASRSLKKTSYYDKLPDDYLTFLETTTKSKNKSK
tara:strand:- start:463 stop:960 length:498 start_codon:yes stop_codon:yes gene_type:complete